MLLIYTQTESGLVNRILHPSSKRSGAFAYLAGSTKRMMISHYVLQKFAAGQNPHTPLVGGATVRRQVVCVSVAREANTLVRTRIALRHEAEKLANVRTDAPRKGGGMGRNSASWKSNVVRALANQRIPASTWQGKRRG